MDLVLIAQLITGTATLIVALVLVFQLKQQNDQLKLQQKDFVQQIKNQIGERRTSGNYSLLANKELSEMIFNARYDYKILQDRHQKTIFHQWVITTLEFTLLKNLFSKAERVNAKNESHAQDKSGKSKYTSIDYFLESGDAFNITCTDWTAKMDYPDNLRVALYTEELLTWINTKAY